MTIFLYDNKTSEMMKIEGAESITQDGMGYIMVRFWEPLEYLVERVKVFPRSRFRLVGTEP